MLVIAFVFLVANLKNCFVVLDALATLAVTNSSQGQVVGELTPQAGIFWGIPFSQPPLGEYRWKKPRDPLPFSSSYWNATHARPACVQTLNKHRLQRPAQISEDCLYLNVFIPKSILETPVSNASQMLTISSKYKQNNADSLAVMVFIHGGNFKDGAGTLPIYDGRFLSSRGNVIVVTTNYRVGPLGFLVQGEGENAATGNYGLWDQLMALKWVKNNIRYFGGNTNKVTLFGQSAGSESIGILLTSQYGYGLFHQAILESDPMGMGYRDMASAKEFGDTFAETFQCTPGDMECLRKISAADIGNNPVIAPVNLFGPKTLSYALQPWGPVIDGIIFSENPIDAFKKGLFQQMPVIIGDTAAEGYLFVKGLFQNQISDFMYQLTVEILFKDKANELLELYPPKCESNAEPNCSDRMELSNLATDFVFLCPGRSFLKSTTMSAWFYIFNATLPFPSIWDYEECVDIPCHGSDIVYVFDLTNRVGYPFTEQMISLARRMEYYWSNFAKYGNPNGDTTNTAWNTEQDNEFHAIHWNEFSSGTGEYQAIQFSTNGDEMLIDPHKKSCDVFDNIDFYAQL